MVHLYYGGGKGKTTAALGLALRAAGNGWRVVVVQFLKGRRTGELAALGKLGAVVLRGKAGGRFVPQMTAAEREETRAICDANFARARDLCDADAGPVLLVLDEICAAYGSSLVDTGAVDAFLAAVPERVEVVLTGREPPEGFFARADYVTEMRCVRHPFDAGVAARSGVEF
ncbi:MAG: cob(I)yrinic acid a,c-diamide adenosyltransferase [Treponema sp.]|nr:cob(I)yrinic acid a,c-diamide adenosyltransferase [Treponema sp.]